MSRTLLIISAAAAALSMTAPALAQRDYPGADRQPADQRGDQRGDQAGGVRADRVTADYVKNAIQGDNSEIMLGNLALARSQNPAVRQYAQMLINDHAQARQQALATAQSMGLEPPKGPTTAAQMERVKLDVLTGRNFDREFIGYMIRDHQKELADARVQAMAHRGPASRLAAQSIPTLRRQLDTAMNLMRG
jgi:putative membrane protein